MYCAFGVKIKQTTSVSLKSYYTGHSSLISDCYYETMFILVCILVPILECMIITQDKIFMSWSIYSTKDRELFLAVILSKNCCIVKLNVLQLDISINYKQDNNEFSFLIVLLSRYRNFIYFYQFHWLMYIYDIGAHGVHLLQ